MTANSSNFNITTKYNFGIPEHPACYWCSNVCTVHSVVCYHACKYVSCRSVSVHCGASELSNLRLCDCIIALVQDTVNHAFTSSFFYPLLTFANITVNIHNAVSGSSVWEAVPAGKELRHRLPSFSPIKWASWCLHIIETCTWISAQDCLRVNTEHPILMWIIAFVHNGIKHSISHAQFLRQTTKLHKCILDSHCFCFTIPHNNRYY